MKEENYRDSAIKKKKIKAFIMIIIIIIIIIYIFKIKIIGMIPIMNGFELDISTKTAYSIYAKERFWKSIIYIYKILTDTWYNICILY